MNKGPPRAFFSSANSGLSLLTRGTHAWRQYHLLRVRFIPACAGNTLHSAPASGSAPVYPRSRGKHIQAQTAESCMAGLSPLARGTRSQLSYWVASLRFIPARAGNTFRSTGKKLAIAVYPRSRGEHCVRWQQPPSYRGLSPLAWGTLFIFEYERPTSRFIPARAGNTTLSAHMIALAAVYPRSRGEHSPSAPNGRSSTSLSPLARGTR